MRELYKNIFFHLAFLKFEDELIDGKVFNAGYENHKVMDIAKIVKQGVGGDVDIVTVPTDDNRSYHISSEKIQKELRFTPNHTIDDAVTDLVGAFGRGSTMVGLMIFPKIECEFAHAFPGGCRPPFFRYRAQKFFGRELVLLG